MAHVRQTSTGYKIEVKRGGERWFFTRDTESAALRCARTAEVDLDEGRDPYDRYRIVRSPQGMTVGEWVERWLEDRAVAPTTADREHYTFKNHILPAFGAMLLTDIDKLSVQRWVDRLRRRYSHGWTKVTYGLLRQVLADAEDCGLISVSPCRRIRFGEPDARETVWLTPAQVVATADRCGVYGLVVVTLAWTGLRWSELAGVRRDDVNVLRRQLLVVEPFRRARGVPGGYHADPKTRRSKRPIDLPPFLATALGAHLGHRGAYLFVSGAGTPLWHDQVAGYFTKAAADVAPGATLHSLRHSHRTWLEEAMLPPRAIDARLGHASAGSRGRYTHVTEGMRKQVVEVLQRLWDEAAGPGAERASG